MLQRWRAGGRITNFSCYTVPLYDNRSGIRDILAFMTGALAAPGHQWYKAAASRQRAAREIATS